MTSLSRTASSREQAAPFVVRVTDISGNNRHMLTVTGLEDLFSKIQRAMGFPKEHRFFIAEDITGCRVTNDLCLKATNGYLTVINTTRGEAWTRPGFDCQPFERLYSLQSQPPGNESLDHQLTQSRMCGSPIVNTITVGSIQAQQVHMGNNNMAVRRDLAGEIDENTDIVQPCSSIRCN